VFAEETMQWFRCDFRRWGGLPLAHKPGLLIAGLRNVRSITVVTAHGSGKFMNALQGNLANG
jgi:hypothetical protein